jgi:catechol 2,3-dioxygenase-like lactoylglutathione lyase family enzyme
LSPTKIRTNMCGSYESFEITDPEQRRMIFISTHFGVAGGVPPAEISNRTIHTGFVVNDRASTDHFYKDILGFRPYWHGGMKDDKDDWVAMQVPDGTDWIEYMLNISPNADHHTLGVMNHIALGVSDIHATEKQLIANGWKPTDEPKLGRDGKWQLNLYDPDDTRTEFMEFKPKEAPCCSAFTGPHPEPK